MSAPQFPPAVLAALARWDAARRVCEAAREYSPAAGSYTLDAKHYHAMDDAFTALVAALDEHRVTRDAAMHAAESEALDEALAASPHRFKVREIL